MKAKAVSKAKVDAYEKLGAFYLGRRFDPESKETADEPLLYDSKDLLTHAVCIGMTGSGKTGLAVTLLEEAAIDNIPALVIDPKGDMGNLLLTFPDLEAKDFRPWVHADEATRRGMTPDEFAQDQADLWRGGLAKWDQDGERIRRLRKAVDVGLYTPGSETGRPISILSSFGAPPEDILEDADLFQEQVSTTTASLLGLLGIDADPIRSREAILMSNVLSNAWKNGEDLDLPTLIAQIQEPPIEKVGVMPLETFYPAKDRFELAMGINNLLAAPGFESWLKGEPLDVDRLLYTEEGKPRIAIFSLAHLADAERMFFVSLLLNQTLGWMRSRSGTASLRAMLYMDEVFGYLPPTGNPPSKKPLLTLLKQARAFGLGVTLATQNPVDLDYKALSNMGTWFLGRLQTERDKDRVMDGLTSSDGGLPRKTIEKLLSGMDKRVFLLHNVHEDEPVLFKVRWAMSYLRGPLDRKQIKTLTEAAGVGPAPEPEVADDADDGAGANVRPVLPPTVDEAFVPARGGAAIYRPFVGGIGKVHFVDRKHDIEESRELFMLAPFDGNRADWASALRPEDSYLDDDPDSELAFDPLPKAAGDPKKYKSWTKKLSDHIYRNERFELLACPALKEVAEPGETEREFRIRMSDKAHEERDRQTEALRAKYARRLTSLEERLRKAEQKLEKERQQSRSKKIETVLSVGTTIVGALFGRKKLATSSTARRMGSAYREHQDVAHAEENIKALQKQLQEMNDEVQGHIDDIAAQVSAAIDELSTEELRPRRQDVEVHRVLLVWAPFTEDGESAW